MNAYRIIIGNSEAFEIVIAESFSEAEKIYRKHFSEIQIREIQFLTDDVLTQED